MSIYFTYLFLYLYLQHDRPSLQVQATPPKNRGSVFPAVTKTPRIHRHGSGPAGGNETHSCQGSCWTMSSLLGGALQKSRRWNIQKYAEDGPSQKEDEMDHEMDGLLAFFFRPKKNGQNMRPENLDQMSSTDFWFMLLQPNPPGLPFRCRWHLITWLNVRQPSRDVDRPRGRWRVDEWSSRSSIEWLPAARALGQRARTSWWVLPRKLCWWLSHPFRTLGAYYWVDHFLHQKKKSRVFFAMKMGMWLWITWAREFAILGIHHCKTPLNMSSCRRSVLVGKLMFDSASVEIVLFSHVIRRPLFLYQ